MPKATHPAPLSEQWLKDRLEEKTWYKVEVTAKAAGKKASAKVYIFDEISIWGVSAQALVQEIGKLDVETLDVRINSPGGSFFDGVAIMNSLRDHTAKVVVTVDGLAASAASVVAMGGDEVVMSRGSQLMIHEASIIALGKVDDLTKALNQLNSINATMAEIYRAKAGGTAEEWATAMSEETWYRAQEAVDAGLADRVDEAVPEETVAAALARFDFTVYAHAGRDDAPDPYTPPAEPDGSKETDKEGGKEMPLNKKLVATATRLGVKDPDKLADDAALIDAIDTQTEANAKAQADADAAEKARKDAEGAEKTPAPNPSSVPAGMMLVDSETITALQASAKRSDEVVREAKAEKRDNAIAQAVHDGKIPVDRADYWKGQWDIDPDGIKAALDRIPKGLHVPTGQIGSAESEVSDPDYAALYPGEEN